MWRTCSVTMESVMIRTMFALLILSAVVACGGDDPNPTPTAAPDADVGCTADEIQRIRDLATSGAMSAYAEAMQGVRTMDDGLIDSALDDVRDARANLADEDWGTCGAAIQAKLLDSADTNITAMEAFATGDRDDGDAGLDRGQQLYLEANTLLTNLAPD